MSSHEFFMRRCFELANKGKGHVWPNPLVGCVIVHEGKIIAEGYHEKYGGAHAEVNAIREVSDEQLLQQSALYVNLEPCSHYGKTPPCADLLVKHKIRRVVIGCLDSNPLVKGNGVEKLRKAGIEVISGVLENEARKLNSRFLASHEQLRPYVLLKWAQTADGYIDHDRSIHGDKPAKISHPSLDAQLHGLRAKYDAILVGAGTALADNPQLTVRHVEGTDPWRMVLDVEGCLPETLHLFDGSAPTLVFTAHPKANRRNLGFVKIDPGGNALRQLLDYLYDNGVKTLLVEGGAKLLSSFIRSGWWDEAMVIVSQDKNFGGGVKAPLFDLSHPDAVSGFGLHSFTNKE